MYHNLIMDSPVEGCLGWLRFLAIVTEVAMNIAEQMSVV